MERLRSLLFESLAILWWLYASQQPSLRANVVDMMLGIHITGVEMGNFGNLSKQ